MVKHSIIYLVTFNKLILFLRLSTDKHESNDGPEITRRKTTPCIHILQSLDEIEANVTG